MRLLSCTVTFVLIGSMLACNSGTDKKVVIKTPEVAEIPDEDTTKSPLLAAGLGVDAVTILVKNLDRQLI